LNAPDVKQIIHTTDDLQDIAAMKNAHVAWIKPTVPEYAFRRFRVPQVTRPSSLLQAHAPDQNPL
ncbi:MAG TPA: hypothetical protein VJZ49_12275, partial [Syntrophales bacterium]|nr:hypothetical protein [Syntrophales bacterium]